ncbi:hypothetical protein RDI58_002280 [Solanum bulbocastanum]
MDESQISPNDVVGKV